MAKKLFNSPSVIYIMVDRLQCQDGQVVSHAVEHVKDRISTEAKGNVNMEKIRRRKSTGKPRGDPDDSYTSEDNKPEI